LLFQPALEADSGEDVAELELHRSVGLGLVYQHIGYQVVLCGVGAGNGVGQRGRTGSCAGGNSCNVVCLAPSEESHLSVRVVRRDARPHRQRIVCPFACGIPRYVQIVHELRLGGRGGVFPVVRDGAVGIDKEAGVACFQAVEVGNGSAGVRFAVSGRAGIRCAGHRFIHKESDDLAREFAAVGFVLRLAGSESKQHPDCCKSEEREESEERSGVFACCLSLAGYFVFF